jgi:hypothetical protein
MPTTRGTRAQVSKKIHFVGACKTSAPNSSNEDGLGKPHLFSRDAILSRKKIIPKKAANCTGMPAAAMTFGGVR